MTILRSCSACGKPSPNPQCEEHTRKPFEGSERRAHTVSGWEQQRRAKRIKAKFMNACYRCGRVFPPEELECDHIVPIAEGGPDTDENCAPCCRECHREKSFEDSRRGRERARNR